MYLVFFNLAEVEFVLLCLKSNWHWKLITYGHLHAQWDSAGPINNTTLVLCNFADFLRPLGLLHFEIFFYVWLLYYVWH